VGLVVLAGTGWWFYLKTVIPSLVGAVPANAILAFDDPAGCAKLGDGWEDAGLEGKFILAAGKSSPRWAYRVPGGNDKFELTQNNLPVTYYTIASINSGPNKVYDYIVGVSTNKKPDGNYIEVGQKSPVPIDMPPYIPLWLCKKKS
jgi:hypothetical protein